MNLKQWLDQERGRYTALSVHLKVSVGRISQMADDGVPPKYMLSLRDFTDGVVSLESMVEARTPGTSGVVDAPLEAATAKAAKANLIEHSTPPLDEPTLHAAMAQAFKDGVIKDQRDPNKCGRRELDTEAYAALDASKAAGQGA